MASNPTEKTTDIADLWSTALRGYYETTGQDLRTLPRFTSVNDIMNDAQLKNDLFDGFRHDKSKVDKLRSAITRNSDLVMKGAQYIAQAATPAFPPAAAILTAFTYVMKACKDVSADYDKITSFFDEMNNFLERVSIIESRMPTVPAYKLFLTRVFSSMMNLLAIATKAVKKGRFKKWFKTLLEGGGDDELAGAYGTMETALKRLESATNFATLGNTEEIKKDTKHVIVSTQRIDITTQEIDLRAQDIQSSVKDGFLAVTEMQTQLAENFAKMMAEQEKKAAKAQSQVHKSKDKGKEPGARKHAAFNVVRRTFMKPAVLIEQAEDIEASYVHGTGEWIFEEKSYGSWSSNEKSVLLLVGGSGVGKSNLAFSVVQKLSETTDYDPRSSVAYFYFKDEQEELKTMTTATASLIRQLAEQDTIYCEQAAAEIDKNENETVNTTDWQALWEKYLISKFPEDGEGNAYLVLDGLDEMASSADKTVFLELLSKLQAAKSKLHVLVTLRPIPEYDATNTECTQLFITKEKISVDFPTLLKTRMDRTKGLSKISKFRKRVKKLISASLQERADGMLFVEHMLRRYNSIGREGAVLKDMTTFCPTDLSSLYALMVAECQSRRTPEQYQALKQLFAWLAFSRRPLTVNEASFVGSLTGQDSGFSIEEELEGKSSRILEVATPVTVGDESDPTSDAEDDEKDATDDGKFPLRFQERSIREYFQAMSVDDDGLRTSPSHAHLTIFESTVAVLCGKAPQPTELAAYSARYWAAHFLAIDAVVLSTADLLRVFESLALILTDHNQASKVIEQHGYFRHYYTLAFVANPEGSTHLYSFFTRLDELLERMPNEDGLSETASTWLSGIRNNPKKIMEPLVRGHHHNWLTAKLNISARMGFMYALDAAAMTDLIPPMTLDQRMNASGETFNTMANLFGPVTKHQGLRMVALVMIMVPYKQHEASIPWFERALLVPPTELRRSYSMLSIAKAHMDIADANDEAEDDHPHVDTAYNMLTAALKLGFEISPEDLVISPGDLQIAYSQKRLAYLYLAKCQRRLKQFDDAIVSYQQAKAILPAVTMEGPILDRWTILLTDEQLLETLESWTLWDRMSWLIVMHASDEEDGDEEYNFREPNDRFQEAAKKHGKLDFMVETYQQVIAYLIKSKKAGFPRLQLAHAYRHVIGDTQKAKKVLYDILDSDACLDSLTGEDDIETIINTRQELSDILYEEFRSSSDPKEKEEILQEYKRIPERRLAQNVKVFNIYESQTAIIAARMTKIVGTGLEYQEILERTFQSCIKGLTDTEGWNDSGSLRLLSKALVCVGLTKDAQIALSAQFSIIDPTVKHYDEDGSSDSESDSGSDAGSESSGSEDEKAVEGLDQRAPDGGMSCDGECEIIEHDSWEKGAIYYCLVCVDADLCESCYQIRKKRNEGMPHEYWREYCGVKHQYIKAPIEGWKGVKNGVMTIGEEKIKFIDWLNKVKDVKWGEAWKAFWLKEGLDKDIL